MLFDNGKVYTPLEHSNAARLGQHSEFQATVNKTLLNNVWLAVNNNVWGGLLDALRMTSLPPHCLSRGTVKAAAYAYIWQLKTADFIARFDKALWEDLND